MEIHVKNCLISISSPFHVFNSDLIICTQFSHSQARSTAGDDFTN